MGNARELISKKEFEKALKLPKIPCLSSLLYHFSGFPALNKAYAQTSQYKGIDFIDHAFDQLEIKLEVNESELARIPKTGPFITVSNHPFGGIDGMALIKLIATQRPDFKVLVNFILKYIEPVNDYFIGVNPFEGKQQLGSSMAGMKLAMKHLQDGNALGFFPAGEVSTFQNGSRKVTDREWQKPALKLIKKARVPIVPIYFHGTNSRSFHLLGKIHPMLRTLRLPYELQHKRKYTLIVRIGNPIKVADQDTFPDIEQFGRFLKAKTYTLGSILKERKHLCAPEKPASKAAPVTSGIGKDIIEEEISTLSDYHIHTQQNFDLYIAPASQIPNILFEIGRLREITFREEGEGTNKDIDLDGFDNYYEHLFLYDRDVSQIVGAYRIGKGKDIIRKYGRRGFYTYSLFYMKDGFVPILDKSIELGRSFIIPEYQNKRLPLFLLWKGILSLLIQNPEYKYIIGPVSISNYYSNVSKSLIVAFIQKHYFDDRLSRFIRSKKQYKIDEKIMRDAASLIENSQSDIRKLDKLIDDIEPVIKSVPVLLKKYIHQNARIIGFNIDPKFNNALDGLMILDFNDVPKETIENLRKEFK